MKSVDSMFCELSRVTGKLFLKNMLPKSFSNIFFSNYRRSKVEIPFASAVLAGCRSFKGGFLKTLTHVYELGKLTL